MIRDPSPAVHRVWHDFCILLLSPADEEANMTENWNELHTALRDDLQKEIHLTRELLSNMRQEEVSLMLRDTRSLGAIMQQRSTMLEKLSALRLHRQETTEKIEKIVKTPAIDAILPPNEEITAEILSLSDQLGSLNERMNRQQTQNHHISEYPPAMMPTARPQAKRKASVATYPTKKE